MQKKLTLINEKGLHARAAAMFVKIASNYPSCQIKLSFNGEEVIGTSILGLMMLSARKGASIIIQIEGKDNVENKKALNALSELIENGFYEDEK